MEILEANKNKVFNVLLVFLIVMSAYFAVKIVYEIKKDSLLGESATPATISFSGHGEVQATPDIANVSFTITKDDKTVAAAQAGVAVIEKKALDFLTQNNVASADVQTSNASFNPTYQYQNSVCPQPAPLLNSGSGGAISSNAIYCPAGKQVLTGYEASESITIKIRNLDNVGAIMQGLGTVGVSNLNGPNFAIDNPDAVQAQARKLAIDDAKSKAEVLAKDLGVTLGKIESFSDSSGGYPIMYAQNAGMSAAAVPATAPAVIPAGQNTISSDVTITYEIK
jgi:uncharacterized protein YggE